MKTLVKIAWRNIWRNRIRSLVVVISLAIGIWATVFILAVSDSLHIESLKDGIDFKYGHIQIHHPDFSKIEKIDITIPNGQEIMEKISTHNEVEAITARVSASGIIASAGYSSNVKIIGVIPDKEEKTTLLKSRLSSGEYLSERIRNPLIIGEKLAKKLKVKLGNKVVLNFEGKNNTLVTSTFRITGMYTTAQIRDEEMLVYTDIKDIAKLAEVEGEFNEIVIRVKEPNNLKTYFKSLQKAFDRPNVLIQDWRQANPDLELIYDMIYQMDFIVTVIVLIALAFGIVNTMLMSILERYKELGILMAIGMNRLKIFLMIVLETSFLSVIGGVIGMIAGFITITILNYRGINLSLFSEGLSGWGFSEIVYPTLELRVYVLITFLVILTAIATSIYPAIKALLLKPNEAIRKQN